MGAAALTCVVGVLINMVFLSNAINFVSYFRLSMHYSPATSANMVTNFLGTSFLLSIVGGFICDSLLTSFTTFIIFCAINLAGVILLAIQAQFPHLRPAVKAKPSLSQTTLDHNVARLISAFFNWSNFDICLGGLISSTVMAQSPTAGNSLTRIIKVLAYAARNWKPSSNKRVGNQRAVSSINPNRADGQSYDKLK
ncbi:hypothetical protein ACFX12_035473 [Malus domestica]